jgi:hypothetical protein
MEAPLKTDDGRVSASSRREEERCAWRAVEESLGQVGQRVFELASSRYLLEGESSAVDHGLAIPGRDQQGLSDRQLIADLDLLYPRNFGLVARAVTWNATSRAPA